MSEKLPPSEVPRSKHDGLYAEGDTGESNLEVASQIFPGIESGKYKVKPARSGNDIQVVDIRTKKTILLLDIRSYLDIWVAWLVDQRDPEFSKFEMQSLLEEILPGLEKGDYRLELVDNGKNVMIQDSRGRVVFLRDKAFFEDLKEIRKLLLVATKDNKK